MAASSNIACRSSHGRSARSRRDDELHLKEMHPMTPIWWRSHKLCSTRCKKLYSTRWWRDWRERWLARIYTRPT
jgi:hypothetical protein